MNIFVLDLNPTRCAQYHVDKHCVKMVLETTQLLNNALVKHNVNYAAPYKVTHQQHPASLWAQSSIANFQWLSELGLALCQEYTYRYSKRHKCQNLIEQFIHDSQSIKMPNLGRTSFALCMPNQYKASDPVISYRQYYRAEKAYIAKWTGRDIPNWWI